MKILFCGLGSIGQRHLRNLKKLDSKAEISCLKYKKSSDIVLNSKNTLLKNKNLKDHYKLKFIFYNFNDAIKYSPDIVFITNPTSLHVEYALKFYNGKTIIFIEKPISHSSKDLMKLYIKETMQKRSFIYSGMQLRFHPLILKLKQIIDKNIIGQIHNGLFFNCEYLPNWHKYEDYRKSYASKKELGGGCLLTQIHELDFVTWIFGYPKSVYGIGGKNSNLKTNVEDNVVSHLKYQKGTKNFNISIYQNFISQPPKREFIIFGSKGNLECNLINNSMILKLNGAKSKKISFKVDIDSLMKKQLIDIFSFIKSDNKQLIKFDHSYKLIKLVEYLKKSMRWNKTYNVVL